ncbi:MAG TPA: hypothetical protein VF789_08395 [Thermoanaerobaculia bacterium]
MTNERVEIDASFAHPLFRRASSRGSFQCGADARPDAGDLGRLLYRDLIQPVYGKTGISREKLAYLWGNRDFQGETALSRERLGFPGRNWPVLGKTEPSLEKLGFPGLNRAVSGEIAPDKAKTGRLSLIWRISGETGASREKPL